MGYNQIVCFEYYMCLSKWVKMVVPNPGSVTINTKKGKKRKDPKLYRHCSSLSISALKGSPSQDALWDTVNHNCLHPILQNDKLKERVKEQVVGDWLLSLCPWYLPPLHSGGPAWVLGSGDHGMHWSFYVKKLILSFESGKWFQKKSSFFFLVRIRLESLQP